MTNLCNDNGFCGTHRTHLAGCAPQDAGGVRGARVPQDAGGVRGAGSSRRSSERVLRPQAAGDVQGAGEMTRRNFVRLATATCGLAATGSFLSGCAGFVNPLAKTQIIVDDVGRAVEIPAPNHLTNVYYTSPLAQIFCLTMAPDLMAGSCVAYDADQLQFLPQGTERLDVMGSLSSGGVIDISALKYNDVQIVFSISGTDLTDVNINDALALQEETGIPVVLIDGSFDRIDDTYRLLGTCLGRAERAEELARYCESIYERVTTAVSAVPNDELVTYYFAEGQEGLQSEPDISQHSLAFQTVRGVNVAANVDPNEPGRSAGMLDNRHMVNISIEEIRAWDPEFIIAWDTQTRSGASGLIGIQPEWSQVRAVKNRRVYTMPNLPFAFCDRPPGVNRFLGIQWLANLFYPKYYDVDMVQVVREFYSTCYWRDISEEQARAILAQ